MGCFCSEEEDPLMAQYRAAKDYATKSTIILQVAGNTEKRGRTQKAIVLYGTHLRCMAVYCFKEFDRKNADELINVAASCRRIATHRATLQQRAIRKAKESCCGGAYIPTDPAAPQMLAPWEWSEWLIMCKGSGDLEHALMKMGLLKMESKQTVALRMAEAARSNVSVSVSQNLAPSISVAPSISGATTSVNPNIVSSNAQTGEGNVTPAVGAGGDGGSSYASAPSGSGFAASALPAMLPPGGMPPGAFFMVHTPQGMVMMPAGSGGMTPNGGTVNGGSGSGNTTPGGDYAAMMQQQQMLMQQQMAAGPGGAPLFYPGPGGAPLMASSPHSSGFPPYYLPSGGSSMLPPGMPAYGSGSVYSSGSGTLPAGMAPPPMAFQQEPAYADAASAPSTPSPMAQGVPVGKSLD